MEKSTQKFLSLLLCLALLFSFPIAASANNKSYEETFTGTYTQPEDARNVLVSGATVSEWYGDRVNMGGHTYTVRQNEYGINKEGNMIEGKVNETYTLWLAQYGVASISFTAPESGEYSVAASETQWTEHSPDWYHINAYSKYFDNELQKERYVLRDREYGCYERDNNYTNLEDAVFHIELEEGENIIITAEAATYNDYVYNLSIKKWDKDNCDHKWRYAGNSDYQEGKCTYSYDKTCEYCGETKRFSGESHNYEYRHTPLGNDMYYWEEYCPYCNKVFSTWTRRHNMVSVNEFNNPNNPCEVTWKSYCEGCGRVSETETEEVHDYRYFEETNGCVTTYGEKCIRCGKVNWQSTDTNHETEYRSTVVGTCQENCEYYCTKCNQVVNSWTYYSHHPDWGSSNPYTIDGCKYSYICAKCNQTIEEYHHLRSLHSYYSEGCTEYCVETCADCGTEIARWVEDTNHNFEYYRQDFSDGTYYTCRKCTKCGETINVRWGYDPDNAYTMVDLGTIGLYSGAKYVSLEKGQRGKITFTPEQSGYYYFYSASEGDPRVDLQYPNGDLLDYSDDYDEYNFCLGYDFIAGYTYEFIIQFYGDDNRNCTVGFTNAPVYYETAKESDDGAGHAYQFITENYETINETSCTRYSTIYRCKDCGKEKVRSYSTHCGGWEYVQKTPQIGAQHQCGTYNYVCTECGASMYDQDLTCHSYNETQIDRCHYQKVCRRCNDNQGVITHHSYDYLIGEIKVNPTCAQNGYSYYMCNYCNEWLDYTVIPATGQHNMVNDWGYAATCTTAGLTNGSHCATCGWVQTAQSTIAATGHNWDGGKVTTEPTAMDTGVKTYTCQSCGIKKTENIAKYNPTKSNPVTVATVKATPTVKASDLKKKDQTIPLKKVAKVQKSKGKVTYKKTSGNKKIKINEKTGKITLKKGLKKGTYKVKMKVQDHGNKKYKAKAKTITFKIKVK